MLKSRRDDIVIYYENLGKIWGLLVERILYSSLIRFALSDIKSESKQPGITNPGSAF